MPFSKFVDQSLYRSARQYDLEAKARALAPLDLLAVQEQIRAEESRLAGVQAQVASVQINLEAA